VYYVYIEGARQRLARRRPVAVPAVAMQGVGQGGRA
jgi:hypothetical protein